MEHNLVCARYCIAVIRAVMAEQTVPELPEGLSLQQLFAFSKMHSVEAMVFQGISQLEQEETDPVWQHWSNRSQMILTQSIVQLADRDEVFTALTEAGLDILPVKGSWLKEQYPQIDYRQMSDLDLLIRKEDRKKARKILEDLGYEKEKDATAAHHDGYEKKPYIAIEVHLQLLPVEDKNCAYYEDPWKKAIPLEENPRIYRFRPEDEYIFYFLHLKHHLDEGGSGIRSILDSHVYRNVYPHMDREYLRQEFQKLGIWEIVQELETLADCWFCTGEDIPEHLRTLEECVFWAGAYGSLDTALQNRMEEFQKYKDPAVRMAAYWLSRFCRPMHEMKLGYPILEKLPVLLPICWVLRILKKCIYSPKALVNHVQKIFRGMKNG